MFSVYLAGELFSYKSLIGNQLLADKLTSLSEGRYLLKLPQTLEFPSNRSKDIRDVDYRAVIECDLTLAQFDGTELDSGTVAEFMLAKSLDIPALLFRSDFRHSGDQEQGGDAWNLMLSHFPRTESLAINAMALYQASESIDAYLEALADLLIKKLDSLLVHKPVIAMTQEQATQHFSDSIKRANLSSIISDTELIDIVQIKRSKGLL